MEIKLSSNEVVIPITFDNGDKETIRINLTDREIRNRISSFEQRVKSRMDAINIEKVKAMPEDNVGVNLQSIDDIFDLSAEQINKLHKSASVLADLEDECNEAIKKELDETFKSNISTAVFKYCQPLDKLFVDEFDAEGNQKTDVYIMVFIRQLAGALESYYKELNVAPERMEKHIGKYH